MEGRSHSSSIPFLAYIRLMKKSARSKNKSKAARVLSRRLVYKGPVFWVTSERVVEPSGVRVLREVVRHTGSVVVLATLDDGKDPRVLLERQYRHAADSYLWELPAGRIDKGEKALAAAKRELLEETGYRAKSWKKILKFYASPGFVAEPMTVFWARGLTPGPGPTRSRRGDRTEPCSSLPGCSNGRYKARSETPRRSLGCSGFPITTSGKVRKIKAAVV